ncbi:MAG TPA: fibronectin type III domain-containing protein [Acidimicrobiales bacterium]
MSTVAGLMLVGTFGLVVAPATSVSATVVSAKTVQIPVASPSSSTSIDVCSSHQPVGYAHCNLVIRSGNVVKNVASATPSAALGDKGAYSPAYLRSAYNVASLDAAGNSGVGQIVAIVDAYSNPSLASDLAYYRRYFNLPACTVAPVSASATGCNFQQVNEQGATSPLPQANASWALEEAVDVEMVSALCPSCQILVVEATTGSMNDLGASVNTAVSLGATVVSNSYGSPEFASENTLSNNYYLHPGVPIVAAAGDNGYGVQFPAASPNVVAVGGTTLIQNTSTGARDGSETAWGNSGSGCSRYEAKPTWQHDTGCANRSVADVSAEANPNTGVWVYDTFGASGLYVAGGTSVAAALVSAIFALAGTSTPSTVNPASNLYNNASSLYHVSSGSNSNCGNYLCNAAQSDNGYAGPSGLGTPGASPNSLAAFRLSSTTSALSQDPLVQAKALGSPTKVEALPGNGEAVVGWTPSVGNSASSVTSYVVTNGSNKSCTYVVTTPETDSCTVTGLTNGQSYHFSVIAKSATLVSPVSPSSNAVTPTTAAAITQVSAGYDNGCALLSSGRVRCWGNNNDGQLGNGSTANSTTPVNVEGITTASQISVNSDNACALLSSGTVRCWGSNNDGQLGNNSTITSASPVSVSGISDATQLSVNSSYACAVLSGGSISCWGNNGLGQLGNGSTTSSLQPTTVSNIDNAVSVTTGTNHACALLSSGTVSCWGSGNYGELGNGLVTSSTVPVLVSGLTGVSSVDVGFNNSCALLSSGTVSCWGYNGEGELGNGSYTNSLTPVTVSGLSNVSSLTTSAYSSCAVSSGAVSCWGYHSAGQLNLGATTNSNTPVVVSKLSGVTRVDQSYSYNYTCVVLNGSGVACWDDGASAPTSIDVAQTNQAALVKTANAKAKKAARAKEVDRLADARSLASKK